MHVQRDLAASPSAGERTLAETQNGFRALLYLTSENVARNVEREGAQACSRGFHEGSVGRREAAQTVLDLLPHTLLRLVGGSLTNLHRLAFRSAHQFGGLFPGSCDGRRRSIDLDLGTMELTPEGIWIDPGGDIGQGRAQASHHAVPEAPETNEREN